MHKEDFKMGLLNWERENLELAKYYFQIACNDFTYNFEAMKYLVYIEIKKGRYDNARSLIEKYLLFSDEYYFLLGRMEAMEGNFGKASEDLQKAEMTLQIPLLFLDKARLKYQMGCYEEALDILDNPKLATTIDTIFERIYVNILRGNYEEAYKLLKTIDDKALNPKWLNIKGSLEDQLHYYMGEFDKIQIPYFYEILVNNDDETLLNHVNKHSEGFDKSVYSKFYESVDLEELLKIIRESIQNMNGIYYGRGENYVVSCNFPVGYNGYTKTNDVFVVTALDTKKIITMYPIIVSKFWNAEKLIESDILMRMRKKNK